MPDEAVLAFWTAPSSDTEQDKQERTERMIRDAIDGHGGFRGCPLSIYAKGSYANNTNVKADSDVDIAAASDAGYLSRMRGTGRTSRCSAKTVVSHCGRSDAAVLVRQLRTHLLVSERTTASQRERPRVV